jgi:hypothetical protein
MCTHTYVGVPFRSTAQGRTTNIKVPLDQVCGTPIVRIRMFNSEDVPIVAARIVSYARDGSGRVISCGEPWSECEMLEYVTLDDITFDLVYTPRADCEVWMVYVFKHPVDPKNVSVHVTDTPVNN